MASLPSAWPRSYRWSVQVGLLSSQEHEWPIRLSQLKMDYEQLVHSYPFPAEEPPEGPQMVGGSGGGGGAPDLDPLTAMLQEADAKKGRLQELDLKYRKEKARRKRGQDVAGRVIAEDEDYDEQAVMLQIIDKDLNRLPDPHSREKVGATAKESSSRRKEVLREILYVYGCAHPNPSYRQGMHEIGSYLLFALEYDGLDPSSTGDGSFTYFLLETVLNSLTSAYDVASPGDPQPLASMSQRILQATHQHDRQLYEKLTSLSAPPQLIFTKWIRLLFSREVKDVLELWDVLFAGCYGASEPMSLQACAEHVGVARLLLHRRTIGGLTGGDCLHWLMNVPVEETVGPWLELIHKLLRKEDLHLPLIEAAITTGETTAAPSTPQGAESRPQLFSALSSVKDKLASKTQSLSKRLYSEWETFAANNQDDPPSTIRSYDDPAVRPTFLEDAWVVSPQQRPQQQFHRPRNDDPARQDRWAQQLEGRLGVLQQFAIAVEKEGLRVPTEVWESIAALERIRLEMLQS